MMNVNMITSKTLVNDDGNMMAHLTNWSKSGFIQIVYGLFIMNILRNTKLMGRLEPLVVMGLMAGSVVLAERLDNMK